MGLHKNITGEDVHVLHSWTYANQTARLAATGFVASDVGKTAYQEDNRTWWLLTNHSAIAWADITAGGASGNDEKVKVSGDDTVADYLASKITAQAPVQLTEVNPGADEDLRISLGTVDHGDLGGVTSDQHHAQAHAIDGGDHTGTLPHSALSSVGVNDHHAQLHAASHGNGQTDEIGVAGLSGELADDQPPKAHDIAGAKHTGSLGHAALTGVSADQHHGQVHAIDGGDHSGQLAHSALSGLDTGDPHTQYLPLTGARPMTGDLQMGDRSLIGVKQARFQAEVNNGDSGGAKTIDWTAGNKQRVALTAACAFTFTAPGGPANLILKLVQDATGGRVATWPASVLWPGGTAPTLSSAASAVDIVALYYDGTNYYGVASLAFA